MRPTQTIQGYMPGLERVEAGAGRRYVRKGRKLVRKGKPGRPRKDPKSEKKRWKAEGERLQTALNLFGYKSQAVAATHAGIKQPTLNAILNGTRGIGVDHLRALAKIGIPSDYIFGLEAQLVPRGQTRTKAKLADDLTAQVKLLALTTQTIPEDWIREMIGDSIDGQALLSRLAKSVAEELQAVAESFRTMDHISVVYRKTKSVELRRRLAAAAIKGKWPAQTAYLKLHSDSFQKLAQRIIEQTPKGHAFPS